MGAREMFREAVEAALPEADQALVDAVNSRVVTVAVATLLDPIQEWIVQVLHRGGPLATRFATELAALIDPLEADLTQQKAPAG